MMRHPLAPVVLAVTLATLSIPFVAASLLQGPPEWQRGFGSLIGWSMSPTEALLVSAIVALPAAGIGGSVGGWVLARHVATGAFIATVLGWSIGVVMLPIAATAMDAPIAIQICIDGCDTPVIETGRLVSGIGGLAVATLWGFLFVLPAIIGSVFLIAAGVLARRRHPIAATVAIVLGIGSFQAMALVMGGLVPYVCLAIGIVTWTALLRGSRYREPPGDEHPVDLPPDDGPPIGDSPIAKATAPAPAPAPAPWTSFAGESGEPVGWPETPPAAARQVAPMGPARWLAAFLIGLALGYLPVVLLAGVEGELAGGLMIFGVLYAAVAVLLLVSALRRSVSDPMRSRLIGWGFLFAGLALGALPLAYWTVTAFCASGGGGSACS